MTFSTCSHRQSLRPRCSHCLFSSAGFHRSPLYSLDLQTSMNYSDPVAQTRRSRTPRCSPRTSTVFQAHLSGEPDVVTEHLQEHVTSGGRCVVCRVSCVVWIIFTTSSLDNVGFSDRFTEINFTHGVDRRSFIIRGRIRSGLL